MVHEARTGLVGSSRPIADLRQRISVAARSDAKVLVTGESGVGKEVVARLLHEHSGRSNRRLGTLNCAGVPDDLLESELFGHTRGSFTGAVADRSGLFESLDRGTAVLDEVGEMSPRMQGLLLRFLDTGELQRVGEDRGGSRVDVRVISATNRNLPDRVAEGAFRLDLFYRINVIHLHVPPLRERSEDVPALLDHFLDRFAGQYGMPRPTVTAGALRAFSDYAWPGNVRELRNVAERMMVDARDGVIDDVAAGVFAGGSGRSPGPAAAGRPDPETLVRRMVSGESFWTVVGGPFLARDLTRDDLRAVVAIGLARTDGSYRRLVSVFNLGDDSERRLVTFLKRYRCAAAS